MATNTAGTSARQDPRQVSNTLKRTINYNDADATAAALGTGAGGAGNLLPKGAFITNVEVEVVVAFNAATSNTLTVGTNTASFNNIVASGDLPGNGTNSLTVGLSSVTRGLGRSLANASDTTVYANYAQTGTSATTGQAVIVITYEGGWST